MVVRKYILRMFLTLVSLCVLAAAITALTPVVFTAEATGSRTTGFPLYSWGDNRGGRLGLGHTTNMNTPQRVGDAENWVMASSADPGGSFAVNTEGHLYSWGPGGVQRGLGPGGAATQRSVPTRVMIPDNDWVHVASFASGVAALTRSGHLYTWGSNADGRLGRAVNAANPDHTPGRVGTATNWVYVAVGGNMLAINSEGHLYSWGLNANGQLGRPVTGAGSVPGSVPGRVGTASNWVMASCAGSVSAAINSDGYVYSWGNSAGGRLGRPFTGAGSVPNNVPGRVHGVSNAIDVVVTNNATAVVTADGRIYTWGDNSNGQLGRLITGAGSVPNNVPGRVGTASNWLSVMGGREHFVAINSDSAIYAWGRNDSGQLGIGNFDMSRSVPTPIGHIEGVAGAARGGGVHSLALLERFIPLPAEDEKFLIKRLQKPEGTPVPELSFTFTFERYKFDDIEEQYDALPEIPDRIISLNATNPSNTAGGITTITGEVDVLEDIVFDRVGVFSYIVREVLGSSSTTHPSSVIYSVAEYELRVYVVQPVGQDFRVEAVTVTPRIIDTGDQTVGVVTEYFTFTNVYARRTTDTSGALFVSKTVTGEFAALDTALFDFDIVLTATALCPPDTIFAGRILDIDGLQIGDVNFPSGISVHIQLLHGQRLVFDELIIGTSFVATERASAVFWASVELIVNGEVISVPANPFPDMELSTDTHLIGESRNSAAFTNHHQFTPPTGLIAGEIPYALIGLSVVILIVLIICRTNRSKRIYKEALL